MDRTPEELTGRSTSQTPACATALHADLRLLAQHGRDLLRDHHPPGWQGYRGLDRLGYIHEPRSQRAAKARGEDPSEVLPAVHRVASLTKRWLLGTHQGAIDNAHMPDYLDEFVFRFDRRRCHSRGLLFHLVLQLAVDHDPVR